MYVFSVGIHTYGYLYIKETQLMKNKLYRRRNKRDRTRNNIRIHFLMEFLFKIIPEFRYTSILNFFGFYGFYISYTVFIDDMLS